MRPKTKKARCVQRAFFKVFEIQTWHCYTAEISIACHQSLYVLFIFMMKAKMERFPEKCKFYFDHF